MLSKKWKFGILLAESAEERPPSDSVTQSEFMMKLVRWEAETKLSVKAPFENRNNGVHKVTQQVPEDRLR